MGFARASPGTSPTPGPYPPLPQLISCPTQEPFPVPSDPSTDQWLSLAMPSSVTPCSWLGLGTGLSNLVSHGPSRRWKISPSLTSRARMAAAEGRWAWAHPVVQSVLRQPGQRISILSRNPVPPQSQTGSPRPLVDMEEDGRVKDRDPVAGKGSMCRLETRLLQNG